MIDPTIDFIIDLAALLSLSVVTSALHYDAVLAIIPTKERK
jgi:hypothetical protein